MFNRRLLLFTVMFLAGFQLFAQQRDSLGAVADSSKLADSTRMADTAHVVPAIKIDSARSDKAISKLPSADSILGNNIFLNSKGSPVTFIQRSRKTTSKDSLFYLLVVFVLLFAFLKFIYPRYFSNLFRVFFNTSLRQSQLTDQLLQAKLPSLLFNIFFVLIGSGYIYLLLGYFGKTGAGLKWPVLLACAAGFTGIYMGKFCILKFTGWITGYRQEADTYIFIIFLINKIMSICLIPLIIIIAFSDKPIAEIATLVSFILVAAMILMRFFRSYGLLQNKLKVSRLHFFIYIIGIEIVPILIIYKLALIFMTKNL